MGTSNELRLVDQQIRYRLRELSSTAVIVLRDPIEGEPLRAIPVEAHAVIMPRTPGPDASAVLAVRQGRSPRPTHRHPARPTAPDHRHCGSRRRDLSGAVAGLARRTPSSTVARMPVFTAWVSRVIQWRLMAEVTIRELRNHGGAVVDRVERGEHLTVTRAGRPVAELRPLQPAGLSREQLIERRRRLPAVDPARLRTEIDNVIDTTL
jgi:prevent-host-death family protein